MESIKISYFMGIYKTIIIYSLLSMISCLKTKTKAMCSGFIIYVEVKCMTIIQKPVGIRESILLKGSYIIYAIAYLLKVDFDTLKM